MLQNVLYGAVKQQSCQPIVSNPSQDRQMRGEMTGAGQMMSIKCKKEIFQTIF